MIGGVCCVRLMVRARGKSDSGSCVYRYGSNIYTEVADGRRCNTMVVIFITSSPPYPPPYSFAFMHHIQSYTYTPVFKVVLREVIINFKNFIYFEILPGRFTRSARTCRKIVLPTVCCCSLLFRSSFSIACILVCAPLDSNALVGTLCCNIAPCGSPCIF